MIYFHFHFCREQTGFEKLVENTQNKKYVCVCEKERKRERKIVKINKKNNMK